MNRQVEEMIDSVKAASKEERASFTEVVNTAVETSVSKFRVE